MKKLKNKARTKRSIRRDDIVIAVAGKDRTAGKTGKVIRVLHGEGKVIVQGLNYLKKTLRLQPLRTKQKQRSARSFGLVNSIVTSITAIWPLFAYTASGIRKMHG